MPHARGSWSMSPPSSPGKNQLLRLLWRLLFRWGGEEEGKAVQGHGEIPKYVKHYVVLVVISLSIVSVWFKRSLSRMKTWSLLARLTESWEATCSAWRRSSMFLNAHVCGWWISPAWARQLNPVQCFIIQFLYVKASYVWISLSNFIRLIKISKLFL